ncbi:hypothetical protein F5Y13DRAFT_36799 [Hypoxylon sp. FL1857]|nr:hypothetical protein F5Y13DRAFT_36799 [Hypoxylon sp. FL1857]
MPCDVGDDAHLRARCSLAVPGCQLRIGLLGTNKGLAHPHSSYSLHYYCARCRKPYSCSTTYLRQDTTLIMETPMWDASKSRQAIPTISSTTKFHATAHLRR